MKISKIAISNIRSFEYDPSYQNEVPLDTKSLNLIIGPNASGKSNFVEVIMRMFSSVFDLYGSQTGSFEQNIQNLIRTIPSPTTLTNLISMPGSFTKHRKHKNADRSIRLEILLDKRDIENLKFIRSKRAALTSLYKKYFSEQQPLKSMRVFGDSFRLSSLGHKEYIEFVEHAEQHSSYLVQQSPETVASRYLRDYGLICTLIEIHNELLNRENFTSIEQSQPNNFSYANTILELGINSRTQPLNQLSPPVVLLSVGDRLTDIDLNYMIYGNVGSEGAGISSKARQTTRNLGSKSTQGAFTGGFSDGFERVKSLIWLDAANELQQGSKVQEVINTVNESNPHLVLFNEFIGNFGLNLSLASISIAQGKITFSLLEGKNEISNADFSTGQRAILNIAAGLTLANNGNSLVLIDEIENHLHPSVQANLRDALVASAAEKIQSILVTHSSIFVTTDTLKNTLRFYSKDSCTQFSKCTVPLTPQNKAIFDILQYTNSARIFFATKVILVEGVSDQIIFSAYLVKKMKDKSNIDVLSVGGGAQENWKQIITSFNVKVFIISDLDTLLDSTRIEQIKTTHGLSKKQSIKWEHLNTTEQATIPALISSKRNDDIYVLSKGALEAYVPGINKKVESARNFIGADDWEKLNYKQELRDIFRMIIKS